MPQAFSQNPAPDGETAVTGLVHSVESCGTVDGPGTVSYTHLTLPTTSRV